MPCRTIADLDVSHWREEVTQCRVNGVNIAIGSSTKISPCTSCTCTKDGVIKNYCLQQGISSSNVKLYKFPGSVPVAQDQQLPAVDLRVRHGGGAERQHLQDAVLVRAKRTVELAPIRPKFGSVAGTDNLEQALFPTLYATYTYVIQPIKFYYFSLRAI